MGLPSSAPCEREWGQVVSDLRKGGRQEPRALRGASLTRGLAFRAGFRVPNPLFLVISPSWFLVFVFSLFHFLGFLFVCLFVVGGGGLLYFYQPVCMQIPGICDREKAFVSAINCILRLPVLILFTFVTRGERTLPPCPAPAGCSTRPGLVALAVAGWPRGPRFLGAPCAAARPRSLGPRVPTGSPGVRTP